jgi:hypothetical protein
MAEIRVDLYTDSFDPGNRFAQIKEYDGPHLMGEVLIPPDQIERLIALLLQFQAQEVSHA